MDTNLFQAYIKDILAQRENELLKKHQLNININPRIAQIFENSNSVSSKFSYRAISSSGKGQISFSIEESYFEKES